MHVGVKGEIHISGSRGPLKAKQTLDMVGIGAMQDNGTVEWHDESSV